MKARNSSTAGDRPAAPTTMIQRDASSGMNAWVPLQMPLDALQGERQRPRGRSHEADADVRLVQRSIECARGRRGVPQCRR
jgi:hypothetical protein